MTSKHFRHERKESAVKEALEHMPKANKVPTTHKEHPNKISNKLKRR